MPKDMMGHNRFGPDCTHVIHKEERPFSECLKEIDAKHLFDQMNNPPLSCCRDIDNLTLEIRLSTPEQKTPDVFVTRCACGASHHRLKVETGALTFFASKGESNE